MAHQPRRGGGASVQAPFRRIITGHDSQGKAIIQEDGPPPWVQRFSGEFGPIFYEVWNTLGR